MKIGELAKRTGCKVVTVRYYEKEGLLTKPERSAGNYRLYTRENVARLEFIMHCRKHNMKPDAIRKLLAFRDHPRRDCTWVTRLIDEHISNVNEQIKSLEHLKEHLTGLRRRCAGGYNGETCGIMHSLEHKNECCAACSYCT
ncbi:MAG: Cd(II)/Pb(II)-responsive transcriptional regulator [Deltaproteobacteria bacterium]|nr:Cd(II)/Pb(II)-responsive transcriptional regulator [Deltaproteobacteria bacterium]